MSDKFKESICFMGVEMEVEGWFDKGSPAVMTLPNGDPGYPAEDNCFEITSLMIGGQECYDLINGELVSEIEDQLAENYEEDEEE